METIRELTEDDLEKLADVHIEAVGAGGQSRDQINRTYTEVFPTVFFRRLDGASVSPSLVFEEDGVVRGLVAVGARALRFKNERIWAGVTSRLLVSREVKTPLVSVRLLQAVIQGPQALTFSDRSNTPGRQAMVAAGGTAFPSYSLRWSRPLRPGMALADRIERRLPVGGAYRRLRRRLVERPPSGRLATRYGGATGASLDQPPDALRRGEVSVEDIVESGVDLLGQFELRPDVESPDVVQAAWDGLAVARPRSELVRAGVRNKRDRLVGWYLLQLDEVGHAELVQIAAKAGAQPGVLAHAFNDAHRRGAVAIKGDLFPQLTYDLVDQGCTFNGRSCATAVSTADESLLGAFHRHSVYLSGLEGEYALGMPNALA